MTRRFAAALLLSALLGIALCGCGPEPRATEPAERQPATSSESATDVPDIPPSATPRASGLDAAGVDVELDAMERELDSMEMPSDADFTDAEGALY